MSKRDRRSAHHPPAPALANPEDARARVEALIASGKTREALELAKQLFKETRSAEAEALVVTAYERRIGAMLAQGMYDEATALAALVTERFPAHRQRIAPLLGQSKAIAAGDFRALLAELATAAPPRRQAIEAILTRELRDPRLLADADALAADDPLRHGARAVCDLFVTVTTGPLPDGALGALDQISRHSPLAPWKLLIRALDAYYRRADGAVLANLAAIPPQSAPARLVPVLRHLVTWGASKGPPTPPTLGAPRQSRGAPRYSDTLLVGEAAPLDSRSPAVGALVKGVTGGRAVIQGLLRSLVRALEAKDQQAAIVAVERLMPLLEFVPAVRRTFAVTILRHWYRVGLNPKPLIQALLRNRRDLDWQRDAQRLIALTLERAGAWDEALVFWDAYLTATTRAGALPAAGRAVSRLLLHMAELFPADREEVLDTFGVDSERELEALIRAGEYPESVDRGRLLTRAREADPDPRVYRALVAHYETLDPPRAEAEAEAWRRAHPRDIEPLLYLTRAAERRGAHRRALELLDEAEAINRVHPEVRQGRFRLLLASAERRIREGRFALALADLDRLEKEPVATRGDTFAYLGALRSIATRRNGDGAGAARLDEELAARLGSATMLALILASVAESFSLDPPEASAPASQSDATQALARASDLFRTLDRPLAVRPALLAQVERDLTGASPADLHSLCAGGLMIGRPALTYVASGQGLASDGPLLHRFLLARGRALGAGSAQRDRDRAQRCLRAARELAGRARDMDAVREASAALDTLARSPDLAPWIQRARFEEARPPAPEEIAILVALERDCRELPRFTAEKRGRKRRPARRRQRDLFDDFLAFLDKTL